MENKYFKVIQELVDPQTFAEEGEGAWAKLDVRLIDTLNELKEFFGYTMVINTWHMKNWLLFGGQKWNDRGLRRPDTKTGKPNGAHPKGMAADIDFYKDGVPVAADEIRKIIFANINKFKWIRCIEIGISWVHIDVMDEHDSSRRAGCNELKVMLVDRNNNVSWLDRPVAT